MVQQKRLPPKGVRVILTTHIGPDNEVLLDATAAEAVKQYEAGHRIILTTAGSASGFDVDEHDVVAVAKAVSAAIGHLPGVEIWPSAPAHLKTLPRIADQIRELPGVAGMLILANRHVHGDPFGDGWVDFYNQLSPKLGMPYIIYHVMKGMTAAQYKKLAETDPNFVEIKYADLTNLELLKEILLAVAGLVNVSCGLGDLNGPDWIKDYAEYGDGICGWTSYSVNFAPYLVKEIEVASLAGDSVQVAALNPVLKAYELLRFAVNVRFNNRLIIASLGGRVAYLMPPHRRYDDGEWAEAVAVIEPLRTAEAESKARALAAAA